MQDECYHCEEPATSKPRAVYSIIDGPTIDNMRQRLLVHRSLCDTHAVVWEYWKLHAIDPTLLPDMTLVPPRIVAAL